MTFGAHISWNFSLGFRGNLERSDNSSAMCIIWQGNSMVGTNSFPVPSFRAADAEGWRCLSTTLST